jgi:hypothetical protein
MRSADELVDPCGAAELPDARDPDPADLRGSLGEDAVAQLRAPANGERAERVGSCPRPPRTCSPTGSP